MVKVTFCFTNSIVIVSVLIAETVPLLETYPVLLTSYETSFP